MLITGFDGARCPEARIVTFIENQVTVIGPNSMWLRCSAHARCDNLIRQVEWAPENRDWIGPNETQGKEFLPLETWPKIQFVDLCVNSAGNNLLPQWVSK